MESVTVDRSRPPTGGRSNLGADRLSVVVAVTADPARPSSSAMAASNLGTSAAAVSCIASATIRAAVVESRTAE